MQAGKQAGRQAGMWCGHDERAIVVVRMCNIFYEFGLVFTNICCDYFERALVASMVSAIADDDVDKERLEFENFRLHQMLLLL